MRSFLANSAALAVATLIISACAASSGTQSKANPAISWPYEDPVVELEVVFDGLGERTRGRFFRALTGSDQREGLKLLRPYGITWFGDRLAATDPATGTIAVVDLKGQLRATNRSILSGPVSVAVCGSGLAVTDSILGTVELFDDDLKAVQTLLSGLDRPTGLACDSQRVWVTETGKHRVLEYEIVEAPDGSAMNLQLSKEHGERGSELGQFNFPTSLALDSSNLWIVDTLNFRLQRLNTRSGQFEASFGTLGDSPGEMPRVKGIAVDSAGHLWISDALLDSVALFNQDGGYLMSIGTTGGDPGEFSFPAGIASDQDGRVAVVDSFNRRIQVFRLVSPQAQTVQ